MATSVTTLPSTHTEETPSVVVPKTSRRPRKLRGRSFGGYIRRIYRADHSEQMSKKVIRMLNDLLVRSAARLISEAVQLRRCTRRSSLCQEDIIAATQLCFKGELADYAVNNAKIAIAKVREHTRSRKTKSTQRKTRLTTSTVQ